VRSWNAPRITGSGASGEHQHLVGLLIEAAIDGVSERAVRERPDEGAE
jgi:hypothetical protein